jgi:3'(2'), 5'-bisphosphate nucleotidase
LGEGAVPFETEQTVALAAVLAAGRMCQRIQTELLDSSAISKADDSPVTVADFAAQAVICRMLAEQFPGDPIVAEESSTDLGSHAHDALMQQLTRAIAREQPATPAEIRAWIDRGQGQGGARFWTLDPLDGTRGFLRGDQYAVALALIDDGEVVVGALACPALPHRLDDATGAVGVAFTAARGQGWRCVSFASATELPGTADAPPIARLVQSVEESTSHHALQERIAEQLQLARPALKMDSQAKYAAVARGDAALYLRLPSPTSPNYRENIWDHAAGALLVTEAGGAVTDSMGRRLDFRQGRKLVNNVGIVASIGIDHERVLAVISAAQART